jgi:acetyl esterase/lipase
MYKWKNLFVVLLVGVIGCDGIHASNGRSIPLWENGAPGFEGLREVTEESGDWWVKSVNNPTVTVFTPENAPANGCAVLILPGGGLRTLTYRDEGVRVANYMASIGVTAFVLKYRLPLANGSPYGFQHLQQDAYRAIRLIRSLCGEYGIDPKRVGMMGFSAGTAGVQMVLFGGREDARVVNDRIDLECPRPDFVALVYPGGGVQFTVPKDCPPVFMICADDDTREGVEAMLSLVSVLRRANVSVEAHLVSMGGHGFGIGSDSEYQSIRQWPAEFRAWLTDHSFLRLAYEER